MKWTGCQKLRMQLNNSSLLEKKIPIPLCWFKEFNTFENVGSINNYLVDSVLYSKKKVINYLNKGKRQASCPREILDPITNEKIADNFAVYTDEEYYWVDILSYLIEKYNIRLPEAFVEKCNGNNVEENENSNLE